MCLFLPASKLIFLNVVLKVRVLLSSYIWSYSCLVSAKFIGGENKLKKKGTSFSLVACIL